MKVILIIAIASLALLLMAGAFLVYQGRKSRPMAVATEDSSEALTCGDSPNCVSSLETREAFQIAPLQRNAGKSWTSNEVALAVTQLGGTIEDQSETLLRATFHSDLFGFVDDLTCRFSDSDSVIHVRSKSRVGHSDLGANRKRIEKLRMLLETTSVR